MEEREDRRRPMLSHQLSRVESSNLRDLLKVRDDESGSRGHDDSMTLATVLACESRESSVSFTRAATTAVSSRTLLDVIKDEDDPQRLFPGSGHRGSWKAFKDRLKLRRATSAWSASSSGGEMVVAPGSPRPVSILQAPSALLVPNFTTTNTMQTTLDTHEEIEAESEGGVSESHEQLEGPMRVSLMALLEQQERSGPSFAATVMGLVAEEEEPEDALERGQTEGKAMCVCCVCMVRHKGAAFIPCGHTFCRLCSRELWVSRGNCPLCNGFIREILDIF